MGLELFGDAWSLLIVRDLMFKRRNTFHDFLNAEEKIATNILTERLQRLEAADIISKHAHPNDARRFVYHLTPKGIDLAPVLMDIIVWSATYEETAAPAAEVRRMKRDRDKVLAEIRAQLAAQATENRETT